MSRTHVYCQVLVPVDLLVFTIDLQREVSYHHREPRACRQNRTGYVKVGEKFSYDSVSASESLSFWDLTVVGRVSAFLSTSLTFALT